MRNYSHCANTIINDWRYYVAQIVGSYLIGNDHVFFFLEKQPFN